MPACKPVIVPAPSVQPYRYGLFSVAAMVEPPADTRWEACGVTYVPASCGPARTWSVECDDSPPEKDPVDRACPVEGTPFLVYAAADCDYVGSSFEEQSQIARDALTIGEQRAVEEALWTGNLGNVPSLAGACGSCDDSPGADPGDCCTVLNTIPGADGALSITAGLAALEEYAGQHYGGTPVIHSPRGAAAFASSANLLCVCGDASQKTTVLGSPWAFYGGSDNTGPGGEPAPEGTMWMYATGAVTIRRSEVFTNPGNESQALSTRDNSTFVVAERIYTVTTECFCAAVLVSAACVQC